MLSSKATRAYRIQVACHMPTIACYIICRCISVWNGFVATSANEQRWRYAYPPRERKLSTLLYLAFVLFATKVNIVLPPLDAWNAAFSHPPKVVPKVASMAKGTFLGKALLSHVGSPGLTRPFC